jgi:hypothetical protein
MAAMSDRPERQPAKGAALALHHPDGRPKRHWGLELDPAERSARRRNRRWLLLIFVPSVAILVLALITSGVAQSNAPKGPAQAAPSGYRTVDDGYFTYVVPSSWATNGSYTDSTGDLDTSGPSGWAGEHLGFRTTAPVPGETRPVSLESFGMSRPEPYQLGLARPTSIKGAAAAFAYDVTRPGGFRATAVDAWDARADVEIWMFVDAPPDVTARILASLEA